MFSHVVLYIFKQHLIHSARSESNESHNWFFFFFLAFFGNFSLRHWTSISMLMTLLLYVSFYQWRQLIDGTVDSEVLSCPVHAWSHFLTVHAWSHFLTMHACLATHFLTLCTPNQFQIRTTSSHSSWTVYELVNSLKSGYSIFMNWSDPYLAGARIMNSWQE